MIARRTVLVRAALMVLGNLAALLGCTSTRRSARDSKSADLPVAPMPRASADQLSRDLDRLAKRTYSDQGIAVLLVCENRVPEPASVSRARPVARESHQMAAEFRRQVDLLKQLRPERTGDDLPKLIEVLADRDLEERIRSRKK